MPIPLLEKVEPKLKELIELGIISRKDEPTDWCSPLMVVPKPNGDIQLCMDYTHLNKFVNVKITPALCRLYPGANWWGENILCFRFK